MSELVAGTAKTRVEMSGERAKSGRPITLVPLAALMQMVRRGRRDMHELNRLARKARERLRAAKGFRNKLGEASRIAARARKRFALRLVSAQTDKAGALAKNVREIAWSLQRTALSSTLSHTEVPACEYVGGGSIVVWLDQQALTPVVYVRDAFSNLHEAAIVDRQDIAAAAGERAGTRLIVAAPQEIVQDGSSTVDIVVHAGDEQLVFDKLRLDRKSSVSITDFHFTNSLVRFSGDVASGTSPSILLGLFVDGVLGASCRISLEESRFSGALTIDHSFLDGRAHVMEIRELPGMLSLAHIYEVLPQYLTPWSALQRYARPPLDGSLAPQARHHFRSYQQWFEWSRAAGMRRVPPLDMLHAELARGFDKRHAYPRIEFEKPAVPTVTIIIPVRDRCEVTYYCLCSLLFAFNKTPFEVIVVDDGSSDETRSLAEFVGGIEILRCETGAGFVGACNLGAERAQGEFVLILNNDTQVTARWVDELVAVFRDFDCVGLAGSKLVYPDGRLQEAGGVVWGSGNPWNVGRDSNPEEPRYNYLRKVDYVSGAALMMPRHLWRSVGGFSDEFAPGYFEDTDLAMKVRECGHFVVYVPSSTVYHFEGETAGNSVNAGMKSFQEVNRPKFHRKWSHLYRSHAREGENLDREKDRDVAFRVLFIDHQFPFTDMDAGSYAAFQEVRLFQALGAKVTFLPRNLAWMDRHTMALQRIGVECLYAPFVMNFLNYVRTHASEYDLVYVNRYAIAEQVLPLVRSFAAQTRVAFNLADLHFLRELREAAASTPGYSRARAEETRRAELAAIEASDLTFSYSDVELGIVRDLARRGTKLAKMPWVVDCRQCTSRFSETSDILFLGGFNHPPNVQAATFFARKIMPAIGDRLPGVVFNVIGSGARKKVWELSSDRVRVLGYVPDIATHLDRTRVFVAPLLAGAGLKGKVLDAISHGIPCVLSPIAAEGTGLRNGVDCLIADTPENWGDCVVRLYTNEELWNQIRANGLSLAEKKFGFSRAVSAIEAALAGIGISGQRDSGLVYRHARPADFGR